MNLKKFLKELILPAFWFYFMGTILVENQGKGSVSMTYNSVVKKDSKIRIPAVSQSNRITGLFLAGSIGLTNKAR